MRPILLREITNWACLQAKLHQPSPLLLPSLFLISNNRNLFPYWNKVKKKSKIKDCMAKRRGKQVSLTGILQCWNLEIRTGRIPLHVPLAVFQKLNTITWAAQSTPEFPALYGASFLFYLFLNLFLDHQHLCLSMVRSFLKLHSTPVWVPRLAAPWPVPKNPDLLLHLLAEVMGIVLQLDPAWKKTPLGYLLPKCTRN